MRVFTLHTVVKWKIYSHPKNISPNQLFSNFVSKTVNFTNILPKKVRVKFSFFPPAECFYNFSAKSTFSLLLHFHEIIFSSEFRKFPCCAVGLLLDIKTNSLKILYQHNIFIFLLHLITISKNTFFQTFDTMYNWRR